MKLLERTREGEGPDLVLQLLVLRFVVPEVGGDDETSLSSRDLSRTRPAGDFAVSIAGPESVILAIRVASSGDMTPSRQYTAPSWSRLPGVISPSWFEIQDDGRG